MVLGVVTLPVCLRRMGFLQVSSVVRPLGASVDPMKTSTTGREVVRDVALITFCWCLSVVVVNPIGNFPLSDDWAFGRTVANLLETGHYKRVDCGWITLITNVFWGALFCLPDGFSLTALRFSSLVAALLGLIGAYAFVRHLPQPRSVVVLVALMLGFNPLYYVLSHSFLTDVLFTTLLIWAGVFLFRHFGRGPICNSSSVRRSQLRPRYRGSSLCACPWPSSQLRS